MSNDEYNPLRIQDIDHLEFTSQSLNSPLAQYFQKIGFLFEESFSSSHLYIQGQSKFVVTSSQNSDEHSFKYLNKHGEGVCKIAFLVDDAQYALETAVKRGAKAIGNLQTIQTEEGDYIYGQIQGLGDLINEFIQRPIKKNLCFWPNGKKENTSLKKDLYFPLKVPTSRIDHLTNNVPKGEMDHWVDFYQRIFGFVQTRYFDIKGKKTGLISKVVQLKNNKIIIPINEPESENGQSQIQEYLDLHKGPGVQHIALLTSNILSTVSELQKQDIEFLSIPPTYYQDIPSRSFKITEDIQELEELQLLVDGDKDGYLLQIFTKTCIGPLFFEYIQRKNNRGFGEGNFLALFKSIERDQIERGYLT